MFWGFLKRISPASGSGLTATMVATRLLGGLQVVEHARGVGARVLAADDDELGLLQGAQRDRALADADLLGHRRARGLVAHVGAVRQVVGAVRANHQLVEERSLVAGAPRGVEGGVVRCRQRAQVPGDDLVGPLPGDPFIVCVPPAILYIGSVSRPCWPSHHSLCSCRASIGCLAKNVRSTVRVAASHATALAPLSQNSAVCRVSGSGSGQAQEGQSKPLSWLSRWKVWAVRTGPSERARARRTSRPPVCRPPRSWAPSP